jgi:hypothetical protein
MSSRIKWRQMVALSLLFWSVAGCTTVPAHQRSRLMLPCMQPKPGLDLAFDEHVAQLRESAIGASAGGGASCGCR